MDWIIDALQWYFFLFILGVIGYSYVKRFLPFFFDNGYSYGKTIAILALTYVIFVLATAKLLPFSQFSLYVICGGFVLGIFILKKKFAKHHTAHSSKKQLFIFVGEELLFFGSFLFLVFIRSQEPSVRGLEKFMDFGFINSILRSKFFPPLDMWLSADQIRPSGYPINYYYFGHLTGAVLTKLTGITPSVAYNLILATIFAQSITLVFSLVGNIVYLFNRKIVSSIIFGLLGSLIVNLGGNLHTLYLFTKGYPPESPVPFWTILSGYNPKSYWYPNATRFIPFTIHEFPSYSWVVADLHGHVFDIPFVLVTLTVLFILFVQVQKHKKRLPFIIWSVLLGFLCAVHYMTNAFDGPIYLLLASVCFVVVYGLTIDFFIAIGVMCISFLFFSFPFSLFFSPFVSGIGLNCAPTFLTNIRKLGPFLFEAGNCQSDALWMLFVLWGFFWILFLVFPFVKWISEKVHQSSEKQPRIDDFVFLLFTFGTFLVIIPEFFYIKDIYPAHFRANTMFKLGYQAFIMMGIGSAYVYFRLKELNNYRFIPLKLVMIIPLIFILIYPFYSFPSYYGNLQKKPQLSGVNWLNSESPEDKEIIEYINKNIEGQPVILEAQGDSYTDYNHISAYTGLPTVAGWWVHEWLWRGSSNVIGERIPFVNALYESKDIELTKKMLDNFHVSYVVVSKMEKKKYPNLFEEKFSVIGRKIFTSSNNVGALYQVK